MIALLIPLLAVAAPAAPFFRQPTEKGGMTALGVTLADEIRNLVLGYSLGRERSNRKGLPAVGISGGWHPCFSFILRHLLELPRVNTGGDQWASVVGTIKHEFFARLMKADPTKWLVDGRVILGGILHGTFDGVYLPTKTLFDLKVTSPDTIRKIRAGDEEPSIQHVGQAQAYAAALNAENPGTIENVALVYLPRAFDLRDLHVWTAPLDEEIVRKGLERIVTAYDFADELDLWDAEGEALNVGLAEAPLTPGRSCLFCPFWAPGTERPTRYGCPGKEEK